MKAVKKSSAVERASLALRTKHKRNSEKDLTKSALVSESSDEDADINRYLSGLSKKINQPTAVIPSGLSDVSISSNDGKVSATAASKFLKSSKPAVSASPTHAAAVVKATDAAVNKSLSSTLNQSSALLRISQQSAALLNKSATFTKSVTLNKSATFTRKPSFVISDESGISDISEPADGRQKFIESALENRSAQGMANVKNDGNRFLKKKTRPQAMTSTAALASAVLTVSSDIELGGTSNIRDLSITFSESKDTATHVEDSVSSFDPETSPATSVLSGEHNKGLIDHTSTGVISTNPQVLVQPSKPKIAASAKQAGNIFSVMGLMSVDDLLGSHTLSSSKQDKSARTVSSVKTLSSLDRGAIQSDIQSELSAIPTNSEDSASLVQVDSEPSTSQDYSTFSDGSTAVRTESIKSSHTRRSSGSPSSVGSYSEEFDSVSGESETSSKTNPSPSDQRSALVDSQSDRLNHSRSSSHLTGYSDHSEASSQISGASRHDSKTSMQNSQSSLNSSASDRRGRSVRAEAASMYSRHQSHSRDRQSHHRDRQLHSSDRHSHNRNHRSRSSESQSYYKDRQSRDKDFQPRYRINSESASCGSETEMVDAQIQTGLDLEDMILKYYWMTDLATPVRSKVDPACDGSADGQSAPLRDANPFGIYNPVSGPAPLAGFAVSAEALQAMTTYSPAVLALNDMLKEQVQLSKHFLVINSQLHHTIMSAIERDHTYTTLEDTRRYIDKHRRPRLTYEEALTLVKEEMGYL